jgi:hypothetical protein
MAKKNMSGIEKSMAGVFSVARYSVIAAIFASIAGSF